MTAKLCPDPDPDTLICRTCGRLCEAASGYGGHFRHARGPRCGKPLKIVGEPCARYAGHKYDCRSRYALDNAAHQGRWVMT